MMRALRLRIRPTGRSDDGMTLVETLVAMAVSSALLACVATVTMVTLRTSSGSVSRNDQNVQLQNAIQRVSNGLRAGDISSAPSTADAVVRVAQPNRLAFVADVRDPGVVGTLTAQMNALDPGNDAAAMMTSTGLVPEYVEYSQVAASSPVCFGKKGIQRLVRVPVLNTTTGQLDWPAPPAVGAVERKTCALVTDAEPAFTYYQGQWTGSGSTLAFRSGCDTTYDSTNVLTAPTDAQRPMVQSVGVQLSITGGTVTSVQRTRTCLVNVSIPQPGSTP
jgi:prepilin-type N-terminal cleavage/methylation domain-containing protein